MFDRSPLTDLVINSPEFKSFISKHKASDVTGKIQRKRATIELELSPDYHLQFFANGFIREAVRVPYDTDLRARVLRKPPLDWDETSVDVKDYVEMLDFVEGRFNKRDNVLSSKWNNLSKKKSSHKLIIMMVMGSDKIEIRRQSYSREEGEKIWWEPVEEEGTGKKYCKRFKSDKDILDVFGSGYFKENFRIK